MVQFEQLEQALQRYRLPRTESVPLFAALLSIPLPAERYPALNLSPQHQKQRTQEALMACLLEEAERRPVLVVLEDLHWADPSTLELLRLLLTQTPMARILTLLTFRPECQPPQVAHSHLTQITLSRLGRQPVEQIVAHLTHGKIPPCRSPGASGRQNRWGTAVGRRAHQNGAGIRAGTRSRGPLCADGSAAPAGDSRHVAGFPDGPPGSAGPGQRGGPTRCHSRTRVYL